MITKFKIFKNTLSGLAYPDIERRVNLEQYKYKVGDILAHKVLNTAFIVKSVNDCSDNQDYFLYNPIENDKGWCIEEELRDATHDEKIDLEIFLTSKQYNL